MSFEKISKLLRGDTPGRGVELHYSRISSDDAARRCICQKQANSDSYRHQSVILVAAFIEVT